MTCSEVITCPRVEFVVSTATSLGTDLNRRGNRCRIERKIHLALLIHLQSNVFLFGGLETLRFDSNGVKRYWQKRNKVVPRIVRLRFARKPSSRRSNFHRCAGEDRIRICQPPFRKDCRSPDRTEADTERTRNTEPLPAAVFFSASVSTFATNLFVRVAIWEPFPRGSNVERTF